MTSLCFNGGFLSLQFREVKEIDILNIYVDVSSEVILEKRLVRGTNIIE